jgi:hypothetical protein
MALDEIVSLILGPVTSFKSAVGLPALLGSTAGFFSQLIVTPQALANQLNWTETPRVTKALQWNTPAPAVTAGRPLNWQTVNPLDQPGADRIEEPPLGSSTGADPATPAAPAVEPPAQAAQRNPWIIGIGAGAAFEPDPIFPLVYARIGRFVSRSASMSLRPRYIFGTTDLQGKANSEGVFQMPLTLDLQVTPWLSPYLGGGVSTNTDNTGRANGMVSLGADISISRNLSMDISVNYIVQPNANDSNGGDFELTSVLYLRF